MMGWMAPLRHLSAKLLSDRISSEWEPSMGEVTTIGLDLAKHVGSMKKGATVLRKQVPPAQVLPDVSVPRTCAGRIPTRGHTAPSRHFPRPTSRVASRAVTFS
jgi:hypothetical protein